jgi:hemerythrin superfamily protein
MGEDQKDAIAFLKEQHDQVRSLMNTVASGAGDQAENFQDLVRMLAVHETAEEMVVYPAVRASVPDGRPLADARVAEESAAKDMLSELEKIGVADSSFDAKFATFASAVQDHAEHEEKEVFPKLRDNLEKGTLETMRAALVVAEAAAPTHPHPHGPDGAIGNMVVGPFVAIADRVRDALGAIKR